MENDKRVSFSREKALRCEVNFDITKDFQPGSPSASDFSAYLGAGQKVHKTYKGGHHTIEPDTLNRDSEYFHCKSSESELVSYIEKLIEKNKNETVKWGSLDPIVWSCADPIFEATFSKYEIEKLFIGRVYKKDKPYTDIFLAGDFGAGSFENSICRLITVSKGEPRRYLQHNNQSTPIANKLLLSLYFLINIKLKLHSSEERLRDIIE
jgi:hypothetical protein